jgi:hypothetical protein
MPISYRYANLIEVIDIQGGLCISIISSILLLLDAKTNRYMPGYQEKNYLLISEILPYNINLILGESFLIQVL